jgi:tRNA 2-thiouridine synthesizing protein A
VIDLELDCLGKRCPLPVIELARAIGSVPIGGVVRVLADDPAAAVDIPAWCRMRGQSYAGSPEPSTYDVRRVT